MIIYSLKVILKHAKVMKCSYFVLEASTIGLHASKFKKHFEVSENDSFEYSVSLNPSFPRAYSALIGQMAQSDDMTWNNIHYHI